MNEIIVVKPTAENPLIVAAKEGLYGRLNHLSRVMYEKAISDFLSYIENHKHEFAGSMPVAFSRWLKSLEDAGLQPSTIRTKRTQVRRFLSWGVKVGWIDQSVLLSCNDIEAPKLLGSKAKRWLDSKQLEQLIHAPDTTTVRGRRDKAILAVFVGCALRRSEVSKLTWGHIEKYGDTYVIVNLIRKHGRRQNYISIPNAVMDAIYQYKEHGADDEYIFNSYDRHGNVRACIQPASLWAIVKQYTTQLGFADIKPHDLRRSAARYYKVEKGISLDQLALMLGHANTAVTAAYVNEMMEVEKIANAFELEI